MSEFNYDLLIIGAGPGGYEAAFYAAELGMKVAIVEKDRLGGTCLNRGCIPTKALMHSSDVYRDAAHGAEVGVEVEGLRANRQRIGERKDEVLDTLRNGIAGLIKKKKIGKPHTRWVTIVSMMVVVAIGFSSPFWYYGITFLFSIKKKLSILSSHI